jgi:hypothetical protein
VSTDQDSTGVNLSYGMVEASVKVVPNACLGLRKINSKLLEALMNLIQAELDINMITRDSLATCPMICSSSRHIIT